MKGSSGPWGTIGAGSAVDTVIVANANAENPIIEAIDLRRIGPSSADQ
jgi:hypothetical protein